MDSRKTQTAPCHRQIWTLHWHIIFYLAIAGLLPGSALTPQGSLLAAGQDAATLHAQRFASAVRPIAALGGARAIPIPSSAPLLLPSHFDTLAEVTNERR